MQSYTSIGMKFLLAVGLPATAFTLFIVHSTWQSNQTFMQQLVAQQADLAMAFEIAMEETLAAQTTNPGKETAKPTQEPGSFTSGEVFNKIQKNYRHVILRSCGDELKALLSITDTNASQIYRLFEQDRQLKTTNKIITLNDRNYMAKFAMLHPRGEKTKTPVLHMVAVPLESYKKELVKGTLERLSIAMFVLLGLFGCLWGAFQYLVGRPLRHIEKYFRMAAQQEKDFKFEPLDTHLRDEIGRLALSFNSLGEKLQILYQTLESKVRKRTFQLQQVNARLRQKIRQCRQAEEQAQVLAHEATAASRAKSEFLANMSHEIRTPMNAIIGFGELLTEQGLDDEQLSYAKMIRDSSRNLLALINDILDYSKIEAGKLVINISECKIGELLGEVESMLRPQAIEKQIKFDLLQCDDLPEIVHVDPVRVRQCLINLISNAIKFTQEGHVFISVAMQSKDGQSFLKMDVEDTGIGIAEDKQSIIFDSFTQADGATTRKYGGTGLGLAITKRLTELMGGAVKLTSEIGKGSVFSLMIPANVDWPPKTETAVWNKYKLIDEINETKDTEKGTDMFSGKILVAEDNPSNQKLIGILLQKMGVQVEIADDGNKAVEKCRQDTFDLILMDMQMPNMNGYDATRELRKMGVKTPVIAVTANAMMGDEKKCMDAGCDGYISKPIDRAKLNDIVNQYLAAQVS